jgi:hypothetical protein
MITFSKNIEITKDRKVYLELPEDTPIGEVSISVTIIPIYQPITTNRTLSSFCGILKNDPIFEGDSVEFQRKIRNEW